jgi:hypothetical protein
MGSGAEVGISAGRVHAWGPVGLEGLVTYKYVLRSQGEDGHLVGEFDRKPGKKQYTHQPIEAKGLTPFLNKKNKSSQRRRGITQYIVRIYWRGVRVCRAKK